jgi:hypothetical protein
MIPAPDGKTEESVKSDPGELARILELELLAKRTAWKKASARYRTLRTVSFFLLFLIIAASVAAFLFLFPRLNEQRAQRPDNRSSAVPGR